jgi:HAD superfamily hydrolase (TIGR01459 family)
VSVPILTECRDVLLSYDIIVSDVWGVVHDGLRAHEAACAALAKAREAGVTVVLLSNAPGTNAMVAPVLDEKGVPRSCWDALVTSGDITRKRLVETGLSRIFHIGNEQEKGVFTGLGVRLTGEEDCQIIVATELHDDRRETPESYRPLLARLAKRGLPFLCGNPDYVVHVGDDLLPCAGALAVIYQELGGTVFWAGKPHRPAFDAALSAAVALRSPHHTGVAHKLLMIGDTVRTDLAGARDCGMDALFVVGGVHRDETMPGGIINGARIASLCVEAGVSPVAATAALAW